MEKMVRDAYGTKPSGEVQPLQWAILRYLGSSPKSQCTMSLVSSHLGMTHAPVGRAIHTLANRGYVVQVANPKDARSKLVLMTTAGAEVLKDDPIRLLAQRFDVLSAQDLQSFKRFFQMIAHPAHGDL